jgi:hypothetical protein
LGVVILLAIVVFGYWLYATYTIASAENETWIAINSNMPDPLRQWACTELSSRLGDTASVAPEGCADAWLSAQPVTGGPVDGPATDAPATGTTNQ